MEIKLKGIDPQADLYHVKEAFAEILHSDVFQFQNDRRAEPINFQIELGAATNRRHNGTGVLVVPTRGIGRLLLNMAQTEEVIPKIYSERQGRSKRIFMRDSGRKPDRGIIETLKKVAYQDPRVDRERDDKLLKLSTSLRVDKLQFGIWLNRQPQQLQFNRRVPSTSSQGRLTFAVEWEKDYTEVGNAQLLLELEHKLVRIKLGDPFLDQEAHSIVIKFSNIRELRVGIEFRPYVCFELLNPAILESEWVNRTLTGVAHRDKKKFRQRVGSIDEFHRNISPYAFQIRVTLYQEQDLDEFVRLCHVAGLEKLKGVDILAEKYGFFTSKKLLQVQKKIELLPDVPWTVAFQIECLLHNGLNTTDDLLELLWEDIIDLVRTHRDIAGTVLRDYAQSTAADPRNTDHVRRLRTVRDNRLQFAIPGTLPPLEGLINCHHVTFTPTRMILEGPYAAPSNRVLRRYIGYHDNFLRVDFRDEDMLQYRWDREVDGTTFLQKRVGGILEEGFYLAGRHFEFLAYSSSALRSHAVWFMSPFFHEARGQRVDASSIRKEEGDFSNVLKCPAKYAARLALAFTSTDPSVKVTRQQWKTIEDLGRKPYQHTDGVGTISRELAGLIWAELCRCNPGYSRRVEPSATLEKYQIRFLGYKGVVCIDDQLEGIMMHLRPSMAKFDANEVAEADIEIAKSFDGPGTTYLNRPLVTLLEDRGVRMEAFLNLLEVAIADVHIARDSAKHFISVMEQHRLGSTSGFSTLLRKLFGTYGLDFNHQDPSKVLKTPFLDRLIHCVLSSVLRDIKYRCRIPVPKSWTLVGVADEGPAYIQQGLFKEEEVFTLQEGEIFACIQLNPESEPVYLERNCNISRSPTVHPGDVQRVYAVGKPPDGKICAFRNLVNVVVFSSRGKRSLASCLSGGDLDGDIYDICQYHPLFFNQHEAPAEFLPVETQNLTPEQLKKYIDKKTGKVDQEKVIPHVCDFIVEYINSDVLGLLSDNHLIRADQSSDGIRDKGCIQLAKLCNEAVDYPKNGKPVDISKIPRRLIPYKPDWKRNEDEPLAGDAEFYRSERALGYLFRKVDTESLASPMCDLSVPAPLVDHPIYNALKPKVDAKLKNSGVAETTLESVQKLFRRYSAELRYICMTHTLTDYSARLSEAEVVIGTILAHCSQHRWRKDRIYRMGVHTTNLVKEIKEEIVPRRLHEMSILETKTALGFAWTAWKLITEKISTPEAAKNDFGLNSFSLITLSVVIDCLEHLNTLNV